MTYRLDTPPVDPSTATGSARELLDQAQAKLGFVPNMYRSMALVPGLLATYLDGYQRFRDDEAFTPAEQEVVFLTISVVNGCTYCVAAHSFLAEQMSQVPPPVIAAIREGRPVPDERLAALSRFTRTMVESCGTPGDTEVGLFLDAGFTERQVLGIVLAMAVKTLSNYSNHLSRPELDPPFAGHAWAG